MPRKAETGILGNRKTVPSGCTKNFTLSPGLRWRCSRMAFGMVAWPLLVIADSTVAPLHFLECNTTFGGSQAGLPASQISDRLHVTNSCQETCHELPRSRATRSEPIGKGCAAKGCGPSKSGSPMFARRSLRGRHTGSPFELPIAPTRKKIRTSSMRYPIGETSEARRDLDCCRGQGLRR